MLIERLARNRLTSFVRSRSEWCISRQRVWGVPIPAIHSINTDQAYLDEDTLNHIIPILEKKGVAYWWTGPVEEFLPPKLAAMSSYTYPINKQWRKGTDTMDVWFDSGSSWTMLENIQQQREKEEAGDGQSAFLADVCLEGSDQHRGWFQSQLLTRCSSQPLSSNASIGSPYHHLITHGMVLDEQGKKMSKSLGNIISPMTIIHGGKDKKKDPAYGADLLRLWAATVEYGSDMSIGPKVLSQTAGKLRKIRNSTRFLLGNIQDGKIFRKIERVERKDLGLVGSSIWALSLYLWRPWQIEKYVMHHLYHLQRTAFDCNDIDRLDNLHAFDFARGKSTVFPWYSRVHLNCQSWPLSSILQTLLYPHSTSTSGRIVSMVIPSEA